MKYCGGCRAQYDRVALVDVMRKRLAETIEFVPADSDDAETVLIVCGCPTACAKVEPRRSAWHITTPEDMEIIMEQIKTLDGP